MKYGWCTLPPAARNVFKASTTFGCRQNAPVLRLCQPGSFAPWSNLLFMGEEYGETRPFQYFTSHSVPSLAERVRRGRKREFSRFHWQGEPPDPQDEATFQGSMDSLAPRGLMVCFGNASGPAPLIDTHMLSAKGSLYLTRPSLVTYTAARSELLASARALFKVIGAGHVKVGVSATYALKDAARAQRDLERRKTTGSSVLIP